MNQPIKKVALSAVRQVGKRLIKEYEKFNRAEVMLKSHHEILTKADLMSQEIIINELKNIFPPMALFPRSGRRRKFIPNTFGIWTQLTAPLIFPCIIRSGPFL